MSLTKRFDEAHQEVNEFVKTMYKVKGLEDTMSILANQVGRRDATDGMLKWALSALNGRQT